MQDINSMLSIQEKMVLTAAHRRNHKCHGGKYHKAKKERRAQ